MKKTTKMMWTMLIFLSFSIASINVCCGFSITNVAVVDTDSNTYVIYPSEQMTSTFQYAYSNTTISPILNYGVSSLDGEGNNVAIVSATDYSTYFNGQTNTYMYVKFQGEESHVQINLSQAINIDNVNSISDLSHRILIDMGTITNDYEENGVSKKLTQGVVNIYAEVGVTYSYNLEKITGNAELETFLDKYKALNNLSNSDTTHTKLTTLQAMYNEYTRKLNNVSFESVSNNQIKQPKEAQNDEMYLLWLKKSTAGQEKDIYDLQVLKCVRKIENVEKEVVENGQVKKIIKLPVEFDNITIVLIIIGVGIILVTLIILRKKLEKINNTRK